MFRATAGPNKLAGPAMKVYKYWVTYHIADLIYSNIIYRKFMFIGIEKN